MTIQIIEEAIERVLVVVVKASLRRDLLDALGEEMEVGSSNIPPTEHSWRRGWNAKRQSMLEAINRLLPEEG